MIINPQLFEAYLKCSTKCYLKSLGETGTGNACKSKNHRLFF
jgi:hypothetical protein